MNGETRVKSFVRIKPHSDAIKVDDCTLSFTNHAGCHFSFTFDKVFGVCSTTRDIFEEITSNITNTSFTVIAYGQTGSGKSHTLIGDDNGQGLVHMILEMLLAKHTVSLSFFEIYNEKIFDLLDMKEKTLREINGMASVSNLIKKEVFNLEDFECLYKIMIAERRTGETKLNRRSSRSHLIIRIELDGWIINIADLAGSENNKKTGNTGIRLKESSNINTSLFALNKVITSIINKDKRIPYRDSKLTRILQESLNGNYDCFIIATVVDQVSDCGNTLNTLNFASKSRKVVNTRMPQPGNDKKTLDIQQFQNTDSKSISNKDEDDGPKIANTSPRTLGIVMTPITKQKSLNCFISKALEYEANGKDLEALKIYKTINSFAPDDRIREKIFEIQKRRRKIGQKFTKKQFLAILNSGSFLEIKKLNGVGDKRAQMIVQFVSNGNFFKTVEDLRLLFSEKIQATLLESVSLEDGSA